MKKRPKISDPQKKARMLILSGKYRETLHARERADQRKIFLTDALYVIKNGFHSPKKDHYVDQRDFWNYAIEGEDIDSRKLRVIISFDDNKSELLLIITVYRSKYIKYKVAYESIG